MRATRSIRVAMIVAALLCGCGDSAQVSRSVGARCDSNDECDGRCLMGAAYPDGFCTMSCDDSGDCPGSSRCVEIEGGVCLFECVDAVDCTFLGSGWDCTAQEPRPPNPTMEDVTVCRGD